MSVRVNLLRPDERRAHTAVGRSFIIKIAVGAVAGLVLMFGAVGFLNARNLFAGLKAAEERWAEIETAYERASEVKGSLDKLLAVEQELTGWSRSRVGWVAPLAELEQLVPESMQLTALNVSSKVIEQEVRQESRLEPGAKGKRGETPKQTARVFSVRLDGKAYGPLSDQVVVRFVDDLKQAPTMKAWIQTLQLQGLQRSQQRAGVEGTAEERIFRVEAESMPRVMQ